MEISTKQKILDLVKENDGVSIKYLVNYLDTTKQTVINHLNSLIVSGDIIKIGKPPKTFYKIIEKENSASTDKAQEKNKKYNITKEVRDTIEENFIYVNAYGKREVGVKAFEIFCIERKMEIEFSAKEYFNIYKRYDEFKKDGYINASFKIGESFEDDFLDKMFYIDFYACEKYGKTKLGQIISAAKQGGDKKLMKEIVEISKESILSILKKYDIQAIAYVPPTINREVQLMKELENNFNFKLPKINIFKVKGDVVVPQKTLTKIKDRILNAENTMFVENSTHYKNVLVIDDAVGSGATLHEIAKKIKIKKIADKVFGVSIVGSFKGFDSLNEI